MWVRSFWGGALWKRTQALVDNVKHHAAEEAEGQREEHLVGGVSSIEAVELAPAARQRAVDAAVLIERRLELLALIVE